MKIPEDIFHAVRHQTRINIPLAVLLHPRSEIQQCDTMQGIHRSRRFTVVCTADIKTLQAVCRFRLHSARQTMLCRKGNRNRKLILQAPKRFCRKLSLRQLRRQNLQPLDIPAAYTFIQFRTRWCRKAVFAGFPLSEEAVGKRPLNGIIHVPYPLSDYDTTSPRKKQQDFDIFCKFLVAFQGMN